MQRVAQDLGEVPGFDRLAGPFRKAAHMHQAAHVAGDEHVGLDGLNLAELQAAHAGGDVWKAHRKGASEAAALFGFAERPQLDAGDRAEQGKSSLPLAVPREWQER